MPTFSSSATLPCVGGVGEGSFVVVVVVVVGGGGGGGEGGGY